MRKQIETEVRVGLFVILGIGLIMLSIVMLGGNFGLISPIVHYTAHTDNAEGLINGSKVILGGVPVGTVNSIGFDKEKRNIKIQFSVTKNAADWIRTDSVAEIGTQGVLGDKYLSLHPGSDEKPLLPPASDIPIRPAKDFTHFFSKGDHLLLTLNEIAESLNRILKTFEAEGRDEIFFKNLAASAKNFSLMSEKLNREVDKIRLNSAIGNLNDILGKVNNGTGTIGALINDPSLYDELRALLGGANRNRIIRNLVRQTIQKSEKQGSTSTQK